MTLLQVFNPNFIAVLCAIFIVIIPPLQRLLFGAGAPITFLIGSLDMMGKDQQDTNTRHELTR
jgi:hypothetical protein